MCGVTRARTERVKSSGETARAECRGALGATGAQARAWGRRGGAPATDNPAAAAPARASAGGAILRTFVRRSSDGWVVFLVGVLNFWGSLIVEVFFGFGSSCGLWCTGPADQTGA